MADEIHALNKDEVKSIDYENYFREMDLTDEEKQDRIELAKKFESIFLMLFATISASKNIETQTWIRELTTRYQSLATQFIKSKKAPVYIVNYSQYIAQEVIKATTEHKDEEYFTSELRAQNIAANEANTIGNYREQIKMVKAGYTKKRWITQKDSHVRHTHMLLDDKEINIFDTFQVGDSEMMFPKDHSLGAQVKEIAGCRCVLKYSK